MNLNPCPFCGGTDISVVDEGNFSFIECADCLGAFYQREACCVADNVEAWNKRTQVQRWLQVMADNQLANSPNDPMDEYEQGVWDGLEMAQEIVTGDLSKQMATKIKLHKANVT